MTVLALDTPKYRLYARTAVTCDGCGRAYTDYPSRIAKAKKHYCSASCYRVNRTAERNPKWRGGPAARICKQCSTPFTCFVAAVNAGEGIFCSQKCRHASLRKYPDPVTARREHARRREAREKMARRDAPAHTYDQWLALLARCGHRCVRCNFSGKLTRDHIKPLSKGGDDSIENIQPLCHSCNARKGNRE